MENYFDENGKRNKSLSDTRTQPVGRKKAKDRFTVGELAQNGGVTVRTLQYYDRVGLLTPSEYTEGKRRLYGKKDIIRLQQILFLKSMGFPLEEIRDKLLPNSPPTDLGRMFLAQKEAIDKQVKSLQEASGLLDKVIAEIKTGKEINVENLFTIIAAIRTGNPYAFMIRHFNQDQLDSFLCRFESKQALAFNETLQKLTAKLMELYRQGADPAGAEAQELAAGWWELVMTFTNGDPDMIRKMISVASEESHWPSETKDLKEANEKMLGAALIIYFQKEGIPLPYFEG